MRIVILVDSADLRDPTICSAVGIGEIWCGKHMLSVLHANEWKTGGNLNVDIRLRVDKLQISAGGASREFHVTNDAVVGIVISHLLSQYHGSEGPRVAFQSVSYNGTQLKDVPGIRNNYYQQGWKQLSPAPCVCLTGTRSGYPIKVIIGDFVKPTQKNLDELEAYLRRP